MLTFETCNLVLRSIMSKYFLVALILSHYIKTVHILFLLEEESIFLLSRMGILYHRNSNNGAGFHLKIPEKNSIHLITHNHK